MPPEHVSMYGDAMAAQLEVRRDSLFTTADRFYEIVATYADVHATDVDEVAVVDYVDDDRATLTITAVGAGGNAGPRLTYFTRTFDSDETREIRLYLHGGDDRVVLRGPGTKSMTLRVIGGGGNDGLVDSSAARGGKRVHFHDAGQGAEAVGGATSVYVGSGASRPRSWGETGPLSPDWGGKWEPRPAFPYTSDLGILIYAGAAHTGYGFNRYPYSTAFRIGAGYAPRENKFVASLAYEVHDLFRGVHASIAADYSGIETLYFSGLGNDTELTGTNRFYKLRRGRLLAKPMVHASIGSAFELGLGVRFELSDTDTMPDQPNFISTTTPYGTGTFKQGGVEAVVRLDTRDEVLAPTFGVVIQGGGRFYPELLDVDQGSFGKAFGEAAAFVSFTGSGNQTVALRVGGEKVWGTFPFYDAAFLGGPRRLRGFRRERFGGDASLYGSAELRLALGDIAFLVPLHVGVFGFTDAGRVYVGGESQGDWHLSGGGGLSLAPLYRTFTGTFTVARSGEGTTFYVGSGFGF
jgi:hypothetical protein